MYKSLIFLYYTLLHYLLSSFRHLGRARSREPQGLRMVMVLVSLLSSFFGSFFKGLVSPIDRVDRNNDR